MILLCLTKQTASAEENNPKAENRQKHTKLIRAIKATARKDMKY